MPGTHMEMFDALNAYSIIKVSYFLQGDKMYNIRT